MSKKTSKERIFGLTDYFSFLIIILSFLVSFLTYSSLPDRIATHWNSLGNADGFSGKNGIFIIPFIILALYIILKFIPLIDPKKENIKNSGNSYNLIIISMVIFMFYIFSISLIWNLGYMFNMIYAIIPAFSGLFFMIGHILGNIKPNYTVGIRTPWTLSSDVVWNKTHKFGGRFFKYAAVFSLIGVFFGKYVIWFMIVPIIIVSLMTVLYSYIEYRKLK